MEGVVSDLEHQESVDALKHRLFCTTLDLESLQIFSQEEMRRNEENINQLIQLVMKTCQERDEARDQLQRLLNKITQPSPVQLCPLVSYIQPGSPLIRPTKGNSSIAESDSLSETHNHHSYVSSPADSFFDTVSTPDIPNTNLTDSSNIGVPNQPFFQKHNNSTSTRISSGVSVFDQASAIIDRLVMKKTLPENGKFLQAVMDTGPLLQTLLVSGPLPRWQNPPPLHPFQIPPVTVMGHPIEMLNQTAIRNPNGLVQSFPNALHHKQPLGAAQKISTSMLNISSKFGLCMKRRPMLQSCVSSQTLTGKRQKSQ